jgi:nicotinamide phosphoribosyltransferase
MRYNRDSIILKTDSYKYSHFKQTVPGLTSTHCYLSARGGSLPATVFFGVQEVLHKHLMRPVSVQDVKEASHFCKLHGVPFNEDGWMYISQDLNGKLPVRIRSVPEGTLVPIHNVLMTIESTDPKVSWVPGHLETILMQLWYPTTVASRSYYTRKLIMESLQKTSDSSEQEIEFKHHSFGFRASTSYESAGIGACAELLFSKGTDTVPGILDSMDYYHSEVNGFSISASEHSTITSWGKEYEADAYRNMIKQFGQPGSIFACVSDSYDIYYALEHLWGGELRQEVIDSGATVVIRLDSGIPEDVVSKSLHILEDKFGTTTNSKGYKVLNHNVRVIQGDGININSIKIILDRINSEGFSTTNLALGQGGGSLQKVDRDTFEMAIKQSSEVVNGEERDVFKSPTESKMKVSLKGRLDLIANQIGELRTIRLLNGELHNEFSVMRTVYQNGEILVNETFDTIRARANSQSNTSAGYL